SEAEKSGNGTRIFAKFCFDHGYADAARPLAIHTLGGRVTAQLVERQVDRTVLRMSMGRGGFSCGGLPLERRRGEGGAAPPARRQGQFSADWPAGGNPHAVLFDAPFDEVTVKRIGPLVENHAQFPRRTNVQLIRVVDRRTVDALIWERGAGYTLASG